MRMPEAMSQAEATTFLCQLHDVGITSHHSSREYPSYESYTDAVRRARRTGRSFEHIVKLAAQDFDERLFEPAALEAAIDDELAALGAPTLDNVQWLVRTADTNDDATRCGVIESQKNEIEATFDRLVGAGKVRSFSCFPYTAPFAVAASDLLSVRGLCTYFNLIERDLVTNLEHDTPIIAIRPLAGGRLDPRRHSSQPAEVQRRLETFCSELDIDGWSLASVALSFPLLNRNVTSSIVSVSSVERVCAVALAVGRLEPDDERFAELSRAAEQLASFGEFANPDVRPAAASR